MTSIALGVKTVGKALALKLATVVNFEQFHSQTSACSIRPRRRLEAAGHSIQLFARQVSERRTTARNMAELKKVGSWMQDTYIESGWATFPGMTAPDRGVAQACANLHTASLG